MRKHVRSWNWAHLVWLAGLAPYVLAASAAGWSPFVTLAVHLVLTLAWFGLIEWRWPHRPDWTAQPRAWRRDGAFFGANAVADALGGLLVGAVALAWAQVQPRGFAHGMPGWAAVPLAVVLAEFGAYWLHRLMHRGGWWWRVHAVHHRPEELNVANNLTTHPLNVLLLKPAKLLPLVALGFSADTVLVATLFLQLQSFATHANTRGSMGWLNYVIGTAELHRRHHSVNVDEALNFATALPLWDQVFGTFRYRSSPEPVQVGVQAPQCYPGQTDIWGLLWFPLRRGVTPDSRESPGAAAGRCAAGP